MELHPRTDESRIFSSKVWRGASWIGDGKRQSWLKAEEEGTLELHLMTWVVMTVRLVTLVLLLWNISVNPSCAAMSSATNSEWRLWRQRFGFLSSIFELIPQPLCEPKEFFEDCHVQIKDSHRCTALIRRLGHCPTLLWCFPSIRARALVGIGESPVLWRWFQLWQQS